MSVRYIRDAVQKPSVPRLVEDLLFGTINKQAIHSLQGRSPCVGPSQEAFFHQTVRLLG